MIDILMYISNGLIIFSFIFYILLIILYNKQNTDISNGFNTTKDILHEYDSINIVENKGYLTVYDMKRRVIRIASNNYYGSSISNISIPLIEAGISAIDNYKNKYINFFRNLIPNLKLLYILPIISIMINNMTYNFSDAKISLVITSIFCIIGYILIKIKNEANNWLKNTIPKIKGTKKDIKEKILNFISYLNILDKIIFIGQSLIIIRCIAIILNF